jgi:hypothetical protein
VARRQIAQGGGQKVKVLLNFVCDRLGWQQACPGGRQLNAQRHTPQKVADLHDVRLVLRVKGEIRPDSLRAADK